MCALSLAWLVFGFMPSTAYALSTGVVISQVYGGGGNVGATYNSDFIEIFNRGSTSVSLTGWSVQYAAAGSSAWTVVPLSGSVAAGKYYLIRLGNGGGVGVALPTPDASLTTLNISLSDGKVALVNAVTALAVANPVGLPQVVDFLGYGATTAFESAAAPAPSNSTSDIRVGLGCYETDNNSVDFLIRNPPLARNSASAVNSCIATVLAQYPFDEAVWLAANAVTDTSGNGRNGSAAGTVAPSPTFNSASTAATNARTGSIGTCGYGVFSGGTGAYNSTTGGSGEVSIPTLPTNLNTGAQTSVSFWMYWNGVDDSMPIGWNNYDVWFSGGRFGFNTNNSDVYGVSAAGLANGWHYVSAVFTNGSLAANSLYIDGTLQTLTQTGAPLIANAVVSNTLKVSGFAANTAHKFNGRMDEVKVFNGALNQAQITTLYNETHACSTPPATTLLGKYTMDEAAWAVGTGSVLDSSGNGRHGDVVATTAPTATVASASSARAGNPGTCGYGTFTSAYTSTGRVSIPNLPVNTTSGAQTSVSFWMYWNGTSGTMPIGWQAHDLWFNGGGFGFNSAGSDVYGIAQTGLANTWKHVTAVFTNGNRTADSLYIDGVAQPLTAYSGTFQPAQAVVASTLRVGGWGNDNNYKFTGRIDELNVFSGALTQAQVTALYNETRPCGALMSFQKTVNVLCDPFNGTTNPKNIPGAIVQYVITATNSGSASAVLTQMTDPVGIFTTFEPNLVTGSGGAVSCSAIGPPTSAVGRGFSVDITGDSRGASYPKYLTTTNADADGASHNAGSVTINYGSAMPIESGYAAGEIRMNESVVVKFNAVVN